MKKIIFCLVFVLSFFACEGKVKKSEIKPIVMGEVITLKGVEGGEKKIKRIEGGFEIVGDERKVLMFDIFGTFCPPCQKEASSLTDLQIKYSDKFIILALTYLEEVSDKYIVDNFSDKYNAHYFISNSIENDRIIQTIAKDIKYNRAIQLPFKVMLKDGKYQFLEDVWEGKEDTKFYIGAIGTQVIQKDLEKIMQ